MSEKAELRGMADDIRAFRFATCLMLVLAGLMFWAAFLTGIPPDKYLSVRWGMVSVLLFFALMFARGWIFAVAYLKGWRAGKKSPQDDPRPIGYRGLLLLKGEKQ